MLHMLSRLHGAPERRGSTRNIALAGCSRLSFILIRQPNTPTVYLYEMCSGLSYAVLSFVTIS